jgi:endonuclease G
VAPLAALEAIVRLVGRPPLAVRNGKVELEPLDEFPADTKDLIVATNQWLGSVGRVEFVNYDMSWGGTGWVAERRGTSLIVVTNRHVAALVARRVAGGKPVFMRSPGGGRYGAAIDFGEEVTSVIGDRSRTLPVAGLEYLADDLDADVALLRIDAPAFSPTPLNLATNEAAAGDRVALIGYPAYDPRNDADAQARYFRDLYEVKRLAPGFVMQAIGGGAQLTHDCTSLGGNSGSPLISLEKREVVGLHFAGVYGKGNSAVGVGTLRALLATGRSSVAVTAASGNGGSEGRDAAHPASHFAGRKGFDTAFLEAGVRTPWPKLSAEAEASLSAPSDAPPEPNELRYTHFGVKYSGERRLPLMTAVNVDGARAVRIKRTADTWYSDGRLPADVQLKAANYGDAEIDRGHMVRREDPNWGDAAEAQAANDDTFHYVNAAPQHSRLNQGKQLWQGLENYILDSARTSGFRACVFTGPVLGEDDPEIGGVCVPMEFWKVVATLDEAGTALHATAYLLSQGQLIRDLLERRGRNEALEGVTLGAYRTFQIAVADLAEALGADFDPYSAADPLAREEDREAAGPVFLPLEELEAIRL